MTSEAQDCTWRVGELAAATGLTVRTLRHYDQIGLLRPSARSGSGPRRYTAADAKRLHNVIALRGLGFALNEIGDILDNATAKVENIIADHLVQLDETLAKQHRQRTVLHRLLLTVQTAAEPSSDVLLESIKEATAVTNRLTHEDLQELAQNRRRMTDTLTPKQVALLAARRSEYFAQLSESEREQLIHRRRTVTTLRVED